MLITSTKEMCQINNIELEGRFDKKILRQITNLICNESFSSKFCENLERIWQTTKKSNIKTNTFKNFQKLKKNQ